jgi:DNA modification methylase
MGFAQFGVYMDDFNKIKEDKSWSFEEASRKETSYASHGYHGYPAKFIPQLVRRCILEYSNEGDLVIDPFCGSGTTIVESLIYGRKSVGTDINPVAILISKAKTTPINPEILNREKEKLFASITNNQDQKQNKLVGIKRQKQEEFNERIIYWFPKAEVRETLSLILHEINSVEDEDLRTFFLCGFSQILKTCSIWLQKSNKPTRDFNKKQQDPIRIFRNQINSMTRGNSELYKLTLNKSIKENKVVLSDARKIPAKSNSAKMIVTSPPYVTSYEYADLHQLTALWLGYTNSLTEFREGFIGSTHKKEIDHNGIKSKLAKRTIEELALKSKKEALGVKNYFFEMQGSFEEMYRVLEPKGKACIVIGDTKLKGIDILNAEIFAEIMNNIGFKTYNIIKRAVPSKILPETRDSKTGRFAKEKDADRLAYNYEFILIMER